MKLITCAMLLTFLLGASTTARASDRAFEELANEYIAVLFEMNPEYATSIGEHRYDHRLTDRSAEAIRKGVEVNRSFHSRLEQISPESLSEANAIDYEILKLNLERAIFEDEELHEWQWNPLYYNMGNGIYGLISRDFAPVEERLESLIGRLGDVPAIVAAAKANLQDPPKIHTETAIRQNKGNISLVTSTLDEFIPEGAESDPLKAARQAALEALEAYGEWLETDLLPRSNGEFRLGDAMWRKKLRFTLDSDLSKEAIYRRSVMDLAATQRAMYETALPLYKAYFPEETDAAKLGNAKHVCKTVLDQLAEERPNNENIVERARITVEEATAFVRKNKLVSVPDEPVKLIVMPEFQRGVAVAYCDAPGPMEKELETFYAISPTPEDWSEERTESFFREYNNYMLYDLTVHEAMPGHYLQLSHSNRFEAPTLIRSIFYSGLFVEGWAVYSEKVMAEAGFGGPQLRMQQLKMRLRVIINAIIDQKIHTEGMTEEQAIAMMMDQGFQEDGEASGKWRRACLTSTQLSTYFVGSAEVEDIVEAYRSKHGDKVDQKKMHDTMISFGSPSPRFVRQMMGF
ncbi:MAG: DUF885 domain-containing protein [Candidatus Krumholzibacteriota bacterium]|nr:DUF885 domain-containing protein [Candidatus Krumholzibacteriota bacterium]